MLIPKLVQMQSFILSYQVIDHGHSLPWGHSDVSQIDALFDEPKTIFMIFATGVPL